DVTDEPLDREPAALEFGDRLLEPFRPPGTEHQFRSGLGQRLGHLPTQAARAARNYRRSTRQIKKFVDVSFHYKEYIRISPGTVNAVRLGSGAHETPIRLRRDETGWIAQRQFAII